jgi:hypothetical protein
VDWKRYEFDQEARRHWRILLCWRKRRACYHCDHAGHVPGQCHVPADGHPCPCGGIPR